MRQLLSLLIIIIVPFLASGQFNKFEESDSLFKRYKSPVIDSKIYDRLEDDDAVIYIGCYYTTDTAGKITSQKFVPFNEIGNNYEPSDRIWQSVITALTDASMYWVFKPILWKFDDKKAEADINKLPFQRPFTGRPKYFMIAEISGLREGSLINKISFIKAYKLIH